MVVDALAPCVARSWYWLYRIGRSLSYMKKYFNHLGHLSEEEWWKWKFMFMFLLNNLAREGLKSPSPSRSQLYNCRRRTFIVLRNRFNLPCIWFMIIHEYIYIYIYICVCVCVCVCVSFRLRFQQFIYVLKGCLHMQHLAVVDCNIFCAMHFFSTASEIRYQTKVLNEWLFSARK